MFGAEAPYRRNLRSRLFANRHGGTWCKTTSDTVSDKAIKRLTRRRNNRHLVGKRSDQFSPGEKDEAETRLINEP
jgi:hypothetical protein